MCRHFVIPPRFTLVHLQVGPNGNNAAFAHPSNPSRAMRTTCTLRRWAAGHHARLMCILFVLNMSCICYQHDVLLPFLKLLDGVAAEHRGLLPPAGLTFMARSGATSASSAALLGHLQL